MATSINSYSVSLGMDASGYVNGAALSRRETNALIRDIESARTPAERYENALERLTKAKATGAIQTSTFVRLMDEEKRKLDEVSNAATKSAGGMDSLTGKLKSLVAGYVGLQTITKSIKLAIDVEQTSAQFEVLTGSVERAKTLMVDVRNFANVSPVSLKGAQDAAKMMLAFNIPLVEVNRNLKMLSDISGGNQQRFDSLTLAFSQMSAAGRLMGQDVLQMVNAGFNPLQQISATTGESMIALKKRMEDGGISAREVRDAFMAATEAGGKFHGMTERMAETMGGKLAIASANLELALTKIGTALGPLVITLTEGMDKGTSAIDSAVSSVQSLSDGLSFSVALIKDLSSGGGQIADLFGYGDGNSMENINKFLDLLDKRKQELESSMSEVEKLQSRGGATQNQLSKAAERDAAIREDNKRKAAEQAFQEDRARESSLIDAANQLAQQEDAKERKAIEERQKLESEANTKTYLEKMDQVIQEENRRIESENRLAQNAIRAANDKFTKEADNARRIRDEISKGPQSIEAGSADAAKFMADQVNAAIAATVSPDQPLPTEEQLLTEAMKQTELLQQQAENAALQVEKLQALIDKKPDVVKFR